MERIGCTSRNIPSGKAPKSLKTVKWSTPIHFVISRSCVRVTPPAPKCVDERCNAENAARKCGVFTYNAPLLERKSCKNSIFQNFSFAQREATFLRCALPNLWSGVVRIPRLKNKENQQPLYPLPLFWRVRQRLFLSDGSRTHNLKWAL